ncbi:MAG: DUF3822 family protein [Bacteroidota bacterium]
MMAVKPGAFLKSQVTDESYLQGMVNAMDLFLLADDTQMQVIGVDTDRNKTVVLRDYHLAYDEDQEQVDTAAALRELLESDEFLVSVKGRSAHFALHTSAHSLVPEPLFSTDEIRSLLSLTCTIPPLSRYLSESIKPANARLIYAIPAEIAQIMEQHFSDVAIRHAASAFISCRLLQEKHQQEQILSVNVRRRHIDVLLSAGHELVFFNSFRYRTPEDFIYYLLFSIEQLQLNPDTLPVVFYGELEKISAAWMLSRKYIRNVRFGEKPEGITTSYGFDQFPAHQYHALLSQVTCGS